MFHEMAHRYDLLVNDTLPVNDCSAATENGALYQSSAGNTLRMTGYEPAVLTYGFLNLLDVYFYGYILN